MSKYDTWISTYRIEPLIGELAWGAKANVKAIGTGTLNDVFTLSEHLGTSEAEANEKAIAEVHEWLSENGGE